MTPQEKAAQAIKVDPEKTRFTPAEALQEGADRMALRYGKATKDEIREQRAERERAARDAREQREAALSADATATGVTRPATEPAATDPAATDPAEGSAPEDATDNTPAPAKKTAAAPKRS
jgi:hypothetical protein